MKLIRLAAILVLPAFLAIGCGSTPEEEAEAQPEPVVEQPADTGAEPDVTPVEPPAATQLHPLDDPDSMVFTKTIYFDFDKYDIKGEFRDVLNAHAEYLASNPSAQMTIEGHCDERGTREYNIGLGERRANAIQQILTLQGASARQITTISYGEERPVELGHDESAWGKNRRGEIVYTSR